MRASGCFHSLATALAVCVVSGTTLAATITVDVATKHQVVDGFGGTASRIQPWKIKVGPFYQTVDLEEVGFYDSIGNDMQIYRSVIPPIQASEGAPYDQADLSYEIKLAQHGITRFFASSFSPPGWMKDNGTETGGGHLLPQYYDDFARMCAEYARQFREAVGVDLYGISLQNEPLFQEPYSSCVYNNGTYRDLHAVAGPIIAATLPANKFVGAEDVLVAASRCNGWVQTILGDAQAAEHFGVYAVHCHTQIFDEVNDQYRGWWNTVRTVADANDLPLWMTEVGDNFAEDWRTAVQLAATIGNSFKYGNCAAWVWLQIAGQSNSYGNPMILDGVYGPKYYQQAHYGRFVKLDARRVESTSDDGQVLDVAFQNTDGSVVVVVINLNAANTVTLAGTGLPTEFTVHQSTDTLNMMQNKGVVTTGNSIAVPQNSITTLVSTGSSSIDYEPPARLDSKAHSSWVRAGVAHGLTVDVGAASLVTLTVHTARGNLVYRDRVLTSTGEAVFDWAKSLAAGAYVGRLEASPLLGGPTTSQNLRLTTR